MAKNYFKRNVPYTITGRYFIGDAQGWSMNNVVDFVTIEDENLKDFKTANKEFLLAGKIIKVDEPSTEWESTNVITDEEATELVKQYLPLKRRLETITSYPIAQKILAIAHDTDRPLKTIKLIEAKVAELEPELDTFGFREEDTKEE